MNSPDVQTEESVSILGFLQKFQFQKINVER